MEQKIRRYLTMLACLLMGVAIGLVLNYRQIVVYRADDSKYQEIMALVDQYYIGDDVDLTQVEDGMAAGMIAGLGDRWSYYVSAADYDDFQNNINNSYAGVGITITACYDSEGNLLGYEVTDVPQGGPAEAAGILAGDILLKVDGKGIQDISLQETKAMVQGEEGTEVVLTMQRGQEILDFPVKRGMFTLIPARGTIIAQNVGYIEIDNFDAGCAEAVIGLVEELQGQGATSLLFDVRNNPGGLKRELVALLDYLLPRGTIFHTIDYSGAEEIVTSDDACVALPMAVLVNSNSYSAAEYFACAIQQFEAGKVIGEKTCGKGYYQTGLELSDGSCVNLSIGKYFTPNGESLIDVGVTPDVEQALDNELLLALAQNKLDPMEDPQVQAALGVLLP